MKTDPHSRNCSGETDGAIGGLMTDDLVARLRRWGVGTLEWEAADEIERLRTDVERLDAALVQQMEDSERLRAALRGLLGARGRLSDAVARALEVLGDE